MPRIPTIIAEPVSATPRIPTPRFAESIRTFESPAQAEFFENLTKLGLQLMKAQMQLKEQQENIEIVSASSQFEAGLKQIRENIRRTQPIESETDTLLAQTQFRRDQQSLQQNLSKGITSNRVRQAFSRYTARVLPGEEWELHAESLRRLDEFQKAEVNRVGNIASAAAASELDLDRRNEIVQSYLTLVERSPYNPIEKQALRDKFVRDVQAQNMEITGLSDPAEMQYRMLRGEYSKVSEIDRLKIAERVREQHITNQNRLDKARSVAREAFMENALARINAGAFGRGELEEIQSGRHPILTPADGNRLAEVLENPPGGTVVDQAARFIAEEYAVSEGDLEDIARARQKLNQLPAAGSKVVATFGKELHSAERAVRTLDRQERNDAVLLARDLFEAELPRSVIEGLVPRLRQLYSDKRTVVLARILQRVRKGEIPENVVTDEIGRFQKELEEARKTVEKEAPETTDKSGALQKILKGFGRKR